MRNMVFPVKSMSSLMNSMFVLIMADSTRNTVFSLRCAVVTDLPVIIVEWRLGVWVTGGGSPSATAMSQVYSDWSAQAYAQLGLARIPSTALLGQYQPNLSTWQCKAESSVSVSRPDDGRRSNGHHLTKATRSTVWQTGRKKREASSQHSP